MLVLHAIILPPMCGTSRLTRTGCPVPPSVGQGGGVGLAVLLLMPPPHFRPNLCATSHARVIQASPWAQRLQLPLICVAEIVNHSANRSLSPSTIAGLVTSPLQTIIQ